VICLDTTQSFAQGVIMQLCVENAKMIGRGKEEGSSAAPAVLKKGNPEILTEWNWLQEIPFCLNASQNFVKKKIKG
jgi:hypothetical protein